MSVLVECPHCSTRVLPMAGRVCPACQKNVDKPREPDPEPVVESVYSVAAEQMSRGIGASGIEMMLTQRGLDADAAATVVSNLEQMKFKAHREKGQKMMMYGAFWGLAGIVVTTLTYSMVASAGGGSFVLAWGAIIFGGIEFLRGFVEYVKS